MPLVPPPAPSALAVPRRWPWLLVTAVVLAGAMLALGGLHQREQRARQAEARAQLFAAEVRDTMHEVSLVGDRLPRSELARVLSPVVIDSVHRSMSRLDRIRGQDPARAEILRADAWQIVQLARTTRDPASFSLALTRAASDAAATADAMARGQRDRAHVIAREGLIGSLAVVFFALAVVVVLTTRAQRASLAAAQAHAAAMADMAERDALTGLANRHRLQRDLEALAAVVTPVAPVELVICDLDGFKNLNDTLGHEAGDALLADVARGLVAAAGADGRAYRLGGDEFCVVSAPGATVAAGVRGALAAVPASDGMVVAGSAGAASWPAERPTAREAMKLADERMYAAKAVARGARAA